jgi:pimeloyl-ACP methyl ester carboxylesterase
VETSGGLVHYRTSGSGPAVVLLHQTSWNSAQYRNIMPLLAAAGLKPIALDTPGYGMSDTPAAEPTVADYAALIGEAIAGMGLSQVALVGHHTGASIAAQLAASQPALVARLVLHAPPLYTDQERVERLARPHFDQTPSADGSHWTRRWAFMKKMSGDAKVESLNESILHFFNTGEKEWYGHAAVWHFDLAQPLRKLTMPTLIVSNTGDAIHHFAARVLEMRPDFEFAEIPGGNHYILTEDAPAVVAAMLGFLTADG